MLGKTDISKENGRVISVVNRFEKHPKSELDLIEILVQTIAWNITEDAFEKYKKSK
jgi:hypothetical protein